MADEKATSPALGDDEFKHSQKELAANLRSKFGEWVPRALAANDHLKASLDGGPLTPDELERCREQTMGLVVDLVRMCKNFVWRDAWAFASLQLRQGSTVDQMARSVTTRVAQIQRETHDCQWTRGRQLIETGRRKDDRLGGPSWVDDAWTVGVEESISKLLQELLDGVRSDTVRDIEARLARLTKELSPSGREAVKKFQSRVLNDTGHKVTIREIATVSGHKTDRLVFLFMGYNNPLGPVTRAAIERTLALDSRAFLTQLENKRKNDRVRREALTIRELAEVLPMSEPTIRRRLAAGTIDASRDGKRYLIPISEIKRLRGQGRVSKHR